MVARNDGHRERRDIADEAGGKPPSDRPRRSAKSLLPVASLAVAVSLTEAGGGPGAAIAQPAPVMKDVMVDIRRRRTSDLAAACLAAQGSASSWCSAYLMGVADTLTAMGNGGHKGGICNVDYGIEDLPGIFLTFARGNDRFLNVDMLAGASLAFRQRWPCGG